MKILILSLIALFFIFLLTLLFLKVNLSLNFEKKQGEKPTAFFELSFFSGLIRIKKTLKSKNNKKKPNKKGHLLKDKQSLKDEDTSFLKKVKDGYQTFCAFKYAYKNNSHKLRKAIYAKKINLHINYGSGNAASTGIITGAIWAGIYNVVSFISSVITIAQPKINLVPNYTEKQCSAKCECIITSRLANLIGAVLSMGISYLSFKRKNKKKRKSKIKK